MNRTQVSGAVIRAALLEVLPKTGEPATTRDLVTAVYYHTGNDRVGYGNVQEALKELERQGSVARWAGSWMAVPS